MVISLRNISSLRDHRHNERDLRTRQASCPHLPWHSEVPMCPPLLSHKLLVAAQNPAQQCPLRLCAGCAHPGSATIALTLTCKAQSYPRPGGLECWIFLTDPFSGVRSNGTKCLRPGHKAWQRPSCCHAACVDILTLGLLHGN